MAEVQREPLDPVAVRSKIYGITTTTHPHPSRQHHAATGKRANGGGASENRHAQNKQRHGSQSTSFLPHVPNQSGHNQQHVQIQNQLQSDVRQADEHGGYGNGDAIVEGDARLIKRAASANSALGAGGPNPAAANSTNTAGMAAMGVHIHGANAITAANLSHFVRAFDAAQAQGAAALAQNERLRVLLREKEIETIRLKHENVLLKQIDRRHQKEIEQFEAQVVEAPRIIKGLREELTHLKSKIKIYFAQIGEDSRQLRQLDEERRRLREHNIRLERLVSAKNLADRDTLNAQLEEANRKLLELEKANSETAKKAEYTERNLMNDNRQLRGKIHHMERESLLIRDRIEKLEETIHEKDKAIASLSIYRYNAIHRKQDAVCKICLKREKEESETRRRQAIREKLPEMQSPSIAVVSGTSVQISVAVPAKSESVEYSRLVMYYGDEPAMAEKRKSKAIRLDESDYGKPSKTIVVSELTCGRVYYFSIATAHDDVVGEPTKPETTLVDTLPQAPTAIKTSVSLFPPAVRVSFTQPVSKGGSAITHYRVYTSSSSAFTEKFLVAETEIDDLVYEIDGSVAVMYKDPSIAVPMVFKVAAVNTMGEGQASEASAETVVDFSPNQPAKPIIKRISSSSVQVVSHVEPNRGSPVHSFVIFVHKIQQNDIDNAMLTEKRETVVPTLHAHPYDLAHTLDGLERGTMYKFCVQASNGGGDSSISDMSDDVNIDAMVPAPGDLIVDVMTPSSVRAILPSIAEIETPKIIGYKIMWSDTSDMLHLIGTTDVIPPALTEYIVDELIEGRSYYFSVSLIGEHEESVCSSPVFAPLAAAFELPPSPVPAPAGSEMGSNDQIDAASWGGNMLIKTASKGSNLSLNQRMANMHYGMPAYHDPPMDDNGPMSPRMNHMSPRRSLDATTHAAEENARDGGSGGGAVRDGPLAGRKRTVAPGGGAGGRLAAGAAGTPAKVKPGRSNSNLHVANNTGNLERTNKGGIGRSNTNMAGGAAKHRAAR